jgi:glycosyltransferase involved in cell wall biosynthesis
MKILLCKGQFMGPISGADETLVTYATQLRAAGHSPSVLLMYPHARDDQYYVRLRRAGVPVSSIASTPVRDSLAAGRKLATGVIRTFPRSQFLMRKSAQRFSSRVNNRYHQACRDFFRRSGADVIHVMTPDPSAMVLISAGHEANIPVLYHELGTPFQPPAFEFYYKRFTSVLPLCTEVAALSPGLAEQCREKLPQARALSVLPIMADDLPEGSAARRPPSASTSFGFAARIERLKGAHVLIESFAAARSRFADMRLKIAGIGSQQQLLASRATALGVADHCDFLGAYAEPEAKNAFMHSLDVLVLPSLTEGTPNSIVEAMAHGLPIIASAVGGIPDMITAETGLLVPPGDPHALAEAMCCLAADPEMRARMGSAARARYERFFSPSAVLPIISDTYKRVAARHRPHVAAAAALGGDVERHPWAP